ncbi:MAG: hypothetical protein M1817_000850 [Caeruleum heppii]|nr:MAG: hypothetical protein M1817_000850 [Caeruleum heppii]
MSDDDDYFDEDEFLFWDEGAADGVAAFADDLAEHAVHSPVYLDNDPTLDLVEYWSDWDYYSDEFYDSEAKANNTEQSAEGRHVRRLRPTTDSHLRNGKLTGRGHQHKVSPTQASPIVKWRTVTVPEKSSSSPTRQAGHTVTLLKDWRLKCSPPERDVQKFPLATMPSHETAADESKSQSTGYARQDSDAAPLKMSIQRRESLKGHPGVALKAGHQTCDMGVCASSTAGTGLPESAGRLPGWEESNSVGHATNTRKRRQGEGSVPKTNTMIPCEEEASSKKAKRGSLSVESSRL